MITPRTATEQSAAIASEIIRCNQLLRKLWSDSARHEVIRRRAALQARLTPGIPAAFSDDPHPMWADYPNSANPIF
jgi:hypothetical protein